MPLIAKLFRATAAAIVLGILSPSFAEPVSAYSPEKEIEELEQRFVRQEILALQRVEDVETRIEILDRHFNRVFLILGLSAALALMLFAAHQRSRNRLNTERLNRAVREADMLRDDIRRELHRPETEFLRIGHFLRRMMRESLDAKPAERHFSEIRAIIRDPNVPVSLHYMAQILLFEHDSRWRDAEHVLEQLRQMDPEDPFVLLHLFHVHTRISEGSGDSYDRKRHRQTANQYYAQFAVIAQTKDIPASPATAKKSPPAPKTPPPAIAAAESESENDSKTAENDSEFDSESAAENITKNAAESKSKSAAESASESAAESALKTSESDSESASENIVKNAVESESKSAAESESESAFKTSENVSESDSKSIAENIVKNAVESESKTSEKVSESDSESVSESESKTSENVSESESKTSEKDSENDSESESESSAEVQTNISKPQSEIVHTKPAQSPPVKTEFAPPQIVPPKPPQPPQPAETKPAPKMPPSLPSAANGKKRPAENLLMKKIGKLSWRGIGGAIKNKTVNLIGEATNVAGKINNGANGDIPPFLPVPAISELPEKKGTAESEMWKCIRAGDLAMAQAAAVANMRHRNRLIDRALISYAQAQGHKTNETLYLNWGLSLLGKALHLPLKKREPFFNAAIDKFLAGNVISPHRFDFSLATLYAIIGRETECKQWLATARESGTLNLESLHHAPDFDGVRNQPWFAEFMRDE